MYCNEHNKGRNRENGIVLVKSYCEICKKAIKDGDMTCFKCSRKLNVCQYCGVDIEIKNKLEKGK